MKRSKAKPRSDPPLLVNGWHLYAHPLFLDQLERLTAAVEREAAKNPANYRSSANAKVLAALSQLVFREMPEDPTRTTYRQGGTLGRDRAHWFRAKFGSGRFRLFFRYSSAMKVIVFAWVNDPETLRTYGASTDAYAVLASMLQKGAPPDDWAALLEEEKAAQPRLTRAAKKKRLRP